MLLANHILGTRMSLVRILKLKKEDFVYIYANWNPKAENINEIAKKIGLGLKNILFVDDNPVEREQAVADAIIDRELSLFQMDKYNPQYHLIYQVYPLYWTHRNML